MTYWRCRWQNLTIRCQSGAEFPCRLRFDGPDETLEGPLVLKPPKGGAIFRFVEFEPEDPEVIKNLDGRAAFAKIGAPDRIKDNQRHPFMHRTDGIDYALVVKGKIVMMMDADGDIDRW